jgi:Predicted phosphatases
LDPNDQAEGLLMDSISFIESLPCVGWMFKPRVLLSIAERHSGYISNEKVVNFIKNTNGYKMAIFSSNTKPFIKKHLKKLGIFKKFDDFIVSSDDVGVGKLKSDPEGLKKILKITRVRPHEAIYFGSGRTDSMTAKNAQIKFVRSLDDLEQVLREDCSFDV